MSSSSQEQEIRKKFIQKCAEFESNYHHIFLPETSAIIPPNKFEPKGRIIDINPEKIGPCHYCKKISICELPLIRTIRYDRNPHYKKLLNNSTIRSKINGDDGYSDYNQLP